MAHEAVHIERLAACLGVADDEGLPGVFDLLKGDIRQIEPRVLHLVKGLQHPLALDARLQRLRQALIGRRHAGEMGVAAVAGDLDGIEEARPVGGGRVAHVMVEPHLPIGQHANGLAVLADVGDEHGVGVVVRPLEGAGALVGQRRRAHADSPEQRDEGALLVGIEALAAKQQHGMVKPGLVDDGEALGVDGFRNINAANLGPNRGRDRMDGDSHGRSSSVLRGVYPYPPGKEEGAPLAWRR